MNSSVADTERYSLIYEATDEVNGYSIPPARRSDDEDNSYFNKP